MTHSEYYDEEYGEPVALAYPQVDRDDVPDVIPIHGERTAQELSNDPGFEVEKFNPDEHM